jgi:hypothetical protein
MKVSRLQLGALLAVMVLPVTVVGVRRLLRHRTAIHLPTERALVRAAMAARPGDPWPRCVGHVLLAFPGTREDEKGYHEPGGSFSPGAGSFGVAIWAMADSGGRLVATSDSLPLAEVQQHLAASSGGAGDNDGAGDIDGDGRHPPAIVDTTPVFEARWQTSAPGMFGLEVVPRNQPAGNSTVLAIRSVGPAGGPIRTLDYKDGRLRINDRWTVVLSPLPTGVKLGEEPTAPTPRWWQISPPGSPTDARPPAEATWHGGSGWGFALLSFGGAPRISAAVADDYPLAVSPLADLKMGTPVRAQVPDVRFVPSLQAQIAHLLMSLVRQEPRPGDPINYPLPWLRDGAHVIVALARAGRADVARRLVHEFAERDFFGGFGPEADGPGLALWAMDEVSAAEHDAAFDRWLYPHAHRKAEEIIAMLDTDREMHHEPVFGPIVPSWRTSSTSISLVCDAAEDGLIMGRMDGHRPVLFVNAVSYLGLGRAAAMAARQGDTAAALRFGARATALRAAWSRANHPPQSDNDRTYISALWPTWVGSAQREVIRHNLDARWSRDRTSDGGFKQPREWTYFDVAEAHQWLALGEPARAATTLRYFWDHQVSPGLFVWSEGSGEENSFGLWENIRGWVAPAHVTPHYWTAAEVVLLQLDMLAYVDDSAAEPEWVIGAGAEPSWVGQPLSASKVRTRLGQVDWTWRQGKMDIEIHGPRARVRLGPAFDPSTPLHLQFLD